MSKKNPIAEVKTVGELKKYLEQFKDNDTLETIGLHNVFACLWTYKGVIYVFLIQYLFYRLHEFWKHLLEIDEEKVSTLVILLLITWLIELFYLFVLKQIPKNLSDTVGAFVYGVAIAGASKTASKFIHPRIKM